MTKDDPHSPGAVVERLFPILTQAGDIPWRARLSAALDALQPGDRPREGLVVMPEVPTAEMEQAIYAAWDAFGADAIMGPEEAIAIYRAVVAAASEPEPTDD